MITITLYSFAKKVNSTAQPSSTGTDFSCLIKSPSSIINPVIEMKANPTSYNYAKIADFGRYYFINDIRYDKGIWIVSLNVDVLASYKTTIGSTSSYVLRAANGQNQYLIDNMFPATGKQTFSKTLVESGGTVTYNSGYYLVTVTGDGQSNGKTIYQFTPALFSTLVSTLFTTADGYNWGDLTQGIINSIMNPLEYISSVIWSPVGFTSTTSAVFKCGMWNSGITADIVPGIGVVKGYTISIPKHPQAATYGKYCNMSPYTQYLLDLGFTGLIALDTARLVDVSSIYVQVILDAITGMAIITGADSLHGSNILFSTKTQFGVPIPMSQVSSTAGQIVTDAAEIAGSIASEDYAGAALNATGALIDVAKAAIGSMTSKGAQGTIVAHRDDKYLYARFFEISARDVTNLGKPYYQTATPSSLSGYMKIANAHVAISGTESECSMVNSYLEAGFYYE